MPEVNPVLSQVGIGFAGFLAPPGPEVIRFTVGQPDFGTPQPIVDEAKASLDRGETAYTRPQGTVELCEAVQQHLTQFDINVKADDVVVTPGCKQALFYGMMAVLTPGDEVLLLSPAWPSYDGMVRLTGALPIHVPVRRDNYHPDFDALEAHVTENTKAIILNTPNNPTGAVYTAEETKRLVDFAVKHDLWILDDMIYSTLVWTDVGYTSPCAFEGGSERTITIGGWSKGWAMTGWRLGWITGPTNVMDGVKIVNVSSATHVPTFLMPAAAKALSLDEEVQGLTDIEFAHQALEHAQVQVIPGSLMKGGDGLIRISYATSIANIHEGVRRLREWLESRR
jgi:aspartate/methionine/tyrosine aminotransferase